MSDYPILRTIPSAVAEIRAADPNTQITVSTLRHLVRNGIIPIIPNGNRPLVDMAQLTYYLRTGTYVAHGSKIGDDVPAYTPPKVDPAPVPSRKRIHSTSADAGGSGYGKLRPLDF